MTDDAWSGGMRLRLSSLGAVVVDVTGVRSIRAEDSTGGFGLWPRHEDFLTVLSLGVLSWRAGDPDGAGGGPWRHAALRGGVLSMRGGRDVDIASREVVIGDDLERLAHDVLRQMAARQQAEDSARRQARELEVRALRELVRQLRPDGLRPSPVWS
jgi:F-type H+-transporting ATPase subunit epsilon